MKVRTFWWGVRLVAETEDEISMLKHIAEAEIISCYERLEGEDAGEFRETTDPNFSGEAYPDDKNFLNIDR